MKNAGLWIVQALLAALFLLAGGLKLVMTAEQMNQGPIHLPTLFLRFIGVCEILGALGLILPGMLGIRRGLTPLAAAGLVIIMIGATTVTIIGEMGAAVAAIPFVVGILALLVIYGRRDFLIGGSAR